LLAKKRASRSADGAADRIHIGRRGRNPENFDVTSLAGASDNFSGAEIEEAINSGLYEAFYAHTDLTTDHILHAVTETVPLSRTMAEQIERQRAWVAGRARDASRPRNAAS